MVLAVMAVVVGTLVPGFLSIRVVEQARATSQKLNTVMNTIAGFVQSAGCVPCPVPAVKALGTGRGNAGGRTDGTSCGSCINAVGLLPYRSLGLPENFAKDAYGHWLTYAVDTGLTSATQIPVSETNRLCSVSFSSASALTVKLSDSSSHENIAVMVLSHGANGYGAYRNLPESNTDRLPFPNTIPSCNGITGAEHCNASDTRIFVAVPAAQGDDPFDDVYLYLNRNALVMYLGNLPCTTEWP